VSVQVTSTGQFPGSSEPQAGWDHGTTAKSSTTIWLFKIAMENGPFIDGLPIKNGDSPWLC
jgi:hypothetical protein